MEKHPLSSPFQLFYTHKPTYGVSRTSLSLNLSLSTLYPLNSQTHTCTVSFLLALGLPRKPCLCCWKNIETLQFQAEGSSGTPLTNSLLRFTSICNIARYNIGYLIELEF